VPVLQPSASKPISAAHRLKKKRNPTKEALEKRSNSESNQNQDPNADDYDKYHSKPWQRNEETATKTKNATGPAAVAKTEAEAAEEKKSSNWKVSLVLTSSSLEIVESWVVQTHMLPKHY